MDNTRIWPPTTGLTSKIVPRQDAVLTLSHSTLVQAPASLVFDTVLRAANYPKWNTWVPAAHIFSQPEPTDALDCMRIGSTMQFDVVMNADKPNSITKTPLKVVDICTPSAPTSYLSPDLLADPTFTEDLSKVFRVSWTGNGGMYAVGMKLERFHEVIIRSENECEIRTWEIMGGMLARVVKMMYEGTLNAKLSLWCSDLKQHCEELYIDMATTS